MSETTPPLAAPPVSLAANPPHQVGRSWAPRFWFGASFRALVRLFWHNRVAIHPSLAPIAAMNLAASSVNSTLGFVQQMVYGRRVARTEIKDAPIFVIGHWRSGTTLLHELLALDEQFTFPTSLACFAPHHFLLSERLSQPWLGWLLPPQRPMDYMPLAWNSPQEDEFALCNLGIPSPYWSIGFPNHRNQCQEYLDLESLSDAARRRWQQAFLWFLKQLTFREPKQIVLKSPTHAFRIRALLEMFPDARFLHIVRNPYEVFFSTIKLRMRLEGGQGFQKANFAGLHEQVLDTYVKLHGKLRETRPLVAANRFHELRYEDLIADPIRELRTAYERLGLEHFHRAVPAMGQYFAAREGYRAAAYPMLPAEREEIARRWGEFFRQYGYPLDSRAE